MKQYKKIDDNTIEEITTNTRKIDREFVNRELEAIRESIQGLQEREKEFIDLLKQFK
jgi:hypothetical protein